ncbi:hypothetical protein BCR32DRAFT_264899 [Anaeromyces robustus]|uniref:G-protein coupled receptors family 1 profile domain-containing protein n=1 Tax=Anaeromyces robustus TaxID=1754192 RepID=A0A1Y1XL79_9FUNG|nr:hypothetical protein BCR32DRAFT_264899 [Anaeromyces robustus]|eukprot:ORX86508.1 hypothetical protein BCR32DRAFT_264899 [Anaeromyces robustus]
MSNINNMTNIDENICQWNLNVHNCEDEDYFRSVYIIKLVIAGCVSLLDSALIIYRIGLKRRNIITPYGIASIDGLLLCTGLFAYTSIIQSFVILHPKSINNDLVQEFIYQCPFICVLVALQLYLTGTLNASPRYPGTKIRFPRPRITNLISLIWFIIWFSIEVVGIYYVGINRIKKQESNKEENIRMYSLWILITYITFCIACLVNFLLFLLFGINLAKAANRSLKDMYRSKKIKTNVVVPIRIAILKMKWIHYACNIIMAVFAFMFGFMAFGERFVFENLNASKIVCVLMNIIPPACIFVTLLCIVYGEARSEIITVFPSTHPEEDEYQMN